MALKVAGTERRETQALRPAIIQRSDSKGRIIKEDSAALSGRWEGNQGNRAPQKLKVKKSNGQPCPRGWGLMNAYDRQEKIQMRSHAQPQRAQCLISLLSTRTVPIQLDFIQQIDIL